MNPAPSAQARTAQARQNADPEEIKLWQALEEVQDPEFPISVVDMGLIYGLQRSGHQIKVQLTFTAMGCPCMQFIIDDVRERLLQEPGVEDIAIEIVWDPPWTRQRLSKKGIEQLKTWGVTV
jgi:metal-sulfur cluster biosynthetic enzyme